MFELLERPAARPTAAPRLCDMAPQAWPLTDTRSALCATGALAAAMLDEIDYPMLLVSAEVEPLFISKAARCMLADTVPFKIEDGHLAGLDTAAHAELLRAVGAATQRGLRTLLSVACGGGRTAVSVVPLRLAQGRDFALLILAKQRLCQELTIDNYARECAITPGETLVLRALCDGDSPEAIARQRGVALSTVRSQIGSLRAKTGSRDIKALVRHVAMLPPMVNALRAPSASLR